MTIELADVLGATAVGIGATVVMDGWAVFLRRAFNIPSFDFCLVGRWLLHMRSGVFTHASIAAAEKRPLECLTGWTVHYLIGIVYAYALVALTAGRWLQQPSLWQAVLFGVITVVMPFFVMQPGLGFGIAAAKTPKPAQARLKSLLTHTVFGVGLYLSALLLRYVMR